MPERKWSPAALAWLREYAGSIDSTTLLMAFEAGERAGEKRLRERIEAALKDVARKTLMLDWSPERDLYGFAVQKVLRELLEEK